MKKTALAVCLGALLAGVSLSSQACFTVIVGKDASATGEIIIGHNEERPSHHHQSILGARS